MLGTVHMSAWKDNNQDGTINQIIVIYLNFFIYAFKKLRRVTFLKAESRLFKAGSRHDQDNIFHIKLHSGMKSILSCRNLKMISFRFSEVFRKSLLRHNNVFRTFPINKSGRDWKVILDDWLLFS